MPAPHDDHPRDLIGYGGRMPGAQWPGGTRVALQTALTLESGSEL